MQIDNTSREQLKNIFFDEMHIVEADDKLRLQTVQHRRSQHTTVVTDVRPLSNPRKERQRIAVVRQEENTAFRRCIKECARGCPPSLTKSGDGADEIPLCHRLSASEVVDQSRMYTVLADLDLVVGDCGHDGGQPESKTFPRRRPPRTEGEICGIHQFRHVFNLTVIADVLMICTSFANALHLRIRFSHNNVDFNTMQIH